MVSSRTALVMQPPNHQGLTHTSLHMLCTQWVMLSCMHTVNHSLQTAPTTK